jgi:hypothetical protein
MLVAGNICPKFNALSTVMTGCRALNRRRRQGVSSRTSPPGSKPGIKGRRPVRRGRGARNPRPNLAVSAGLVWNFCFYKFFVYAV